MKMSSKEIIHIIYKYVYASYSYNLRVLLDSYGFFDEGRCPCACMTQGYALPQDYLPSHSTFQLNRGGEDGEC